MADQWKVTASKVHVRNGPSMNNKSIGYVYKGQTLSALETSGVWIRHGEGKWSSTRNYGTSSGSAIMTKISSDSGATTKPVEPKPAPPKEPTNEDYSANGYLPNMNDFYMFNGSYANKDNLTIRNALSILGLPYQFLPNADKRLVANDGAALGRKYAEKIVAPAPLLLITPGEPRFLTNFNKEDKEGVLQAILSAAGGGDANSISSFLSSEKGRYYTFAFAYNDYYNYLNPMCRIAARLLDLQNETLDGVHLDKVDWMTYTAKRIESFTDIGMAGAIPFYVNSSTQISETFSNGTGESMLASKINPISDTSRELNFLLGYGSNALGADFSPNEMKDINANIENVQDIINSLIGKNAMLKNLSGNIITVASGGKLIFPEIWNDSSFSRSYNINIKLTTPDADPLSWYFNICVPVLHLVALVAPRGIDNNAAGYINPFIVRAYYKGLFNCDMGIITDMSINRGGDAAWTQQGLPTSVEVDFTIKDLYSNIAISRGLASGGIFSAAALKNTTLMDYIANFCGININKPEVGRQIDMWFTQSVVNPITDAVKKNIWGTIEQNMQTALMNIYDAFLR